MREERCIEMQWTSGSIDLARKISRYLVQERLVACAQIIPWIESVYMWNNQLETTQETKIIMKTREHLAHKVMKIILENHTYEIPEITWRPIAGGNPEYLNWVQENTPDFSGVEK